MKLIERVINDRFKINMPLQAQPVVKEIWDDQVYNLVYTIKKNDIVFDIGANIGLFSIYAASKGAKVYCFEPNPITYQLLLKNIRENSLEDMIMPFNMALGDKDDFIDLYVADTDRIYAEGSASINESYIKDLGKRVGGEFVKYIVECRRLDSFLEEQRLDSIDLVKLDCEGSEFEIIQDSHMLNRIKNIAMEMHGACYSQKALCQMIINKGVIIDELTPIAEPFSIGYLYGSNDSDSLRIPNNKLVVDFTSSGYGFIDQWVSFDASDSFMTNQKEDRLNFTWTIDGIIVEEAKNRNKMNYRFLEPGTHTVSLEVEADGGKASRSREVIILKSDYLKETINYEAGYMNTDTNALIDSKKIFLIQNKAIPKMVSLVNVVVSIQKMSSYNGLFEPLIFEFNNQKSVVNKKYMEIRVNNIPTDIDVVFGIRPYRENANPTQINVKWWFDQEDISEEETGSVDETLEGNMLSVLPPQGASGRYWFEGEKPFVIPQDLLPKTWVPKNIFLSITSVRFQRKQQQLNGYIDYQTQSLPLKDWYCKSRLETSDYDEDIRFSIKMPEANCIKVSWWCE